MADLTAAVGGGWGTEGSKQGKDTKGVTPTFSKLQKFSLLNMVRSSIKKTKILSMRNNEKQ
jgi:hypothetical protein